MTIIFIFISKMVDFKLLLTLQIPCSPRLRHTLKATHFGLHAARCLYSILMYMNKTYGALLKGLLNGIVKKMMKNRWKKRQNELQRRLTRWLPDISTDRQTPQLHRFHLFAFTIVKRHFILFFQIILARNIATNSH